jgi:hypothetical protein
MNNNLGSLRQRHRELSQSFALVAPLGGGAVLALHALQHEGAQGPIMRCGRTGAPAALPLAEKPPAPYRREYDEGRLWVPRR